MYLQVIRLALVVFVVALCGQPGQCLASAGISPQEGSTEKLRDFLRSYLNQGGGQPDRTTRVSIISTPLQSEAAKEQIVYVTGRGWCGSGGCTLLILEPSADTFKVLGDLSAVQLPVKILPGFKNGHPSISVRARGIKVGSEYRMKLSFDGGNYPSDATLPPAQRLTDDKGRSILTSASTSIPLYD